MVNASSMCKISELLAASTVKSVTDTIALSAYYEQYGDHFTSVIPTSAFTTTSALTHRRIRPRGQLCEFKGPHRAMTTDI